MREVKQTLKDFFLCFLLTVCDLLTRFLYKERPKRIVNQRHRVYRYAGEEERVVLAVQAKGVCSVVTDSQ